MDCFLGFFFVVGLIALISYWLSGGKRSRTAYPPVNQVDQDNSGFLPMTEGLIIMDMLSEDEETDADLDEDPGDYDYDIDYDGGEDNDNDDDWGD